MALWQFKTCFVPRDFIGERKSLTEQEYEDGVWHGTLQPPADFQVRLSALLPPRKSWADELLQWGEQDGDLIEVWMEGGMVDDIGARFDCRNLNARFIRQIFDLSHEWGFRLVYQRHLSVMPDVWEDFAKLVCDSPNLKFMQDPAQWLPKLAEETARRDQE